MSDPHDPGVTSTVPLIPSTSTSIPPIIDLHEHAKPADEPLIHNASPENVTVRRSHPRRKVAPLPDDACILHSPKQSQQPTPRTTPSPHRPAPQIRVLEDFDVSGADATSLSASFPPEVTSQSGTPRAQSLSGGRGKRGGARQALTAQDELPPLAGRRVSSSTTPGSVDCTVPPVKAPGKGRKQDVAKKEKYFELRDRAAAASSLDDLAAVLRSTIDVIRVYNTSPTAAGFQALEEIHERLAAHHELSGASDDATAFSTVVTRAVVAPVKALSSLVEGQQRAIQSLTKSLESLKNAPLTRGSPAPSTSPASYATVAAPAPAPPKPKQPPLPRGPEERILLRFNGPPPPIFHRPFSQILEELNAYLVSLSLPTLLFVEKEKRESPGLFIAPLLGKEGVAILMERWDVWAPGVLPGARIIPIAVHSFLQVDGVQFASVRSLATLKTEFEQRNAKLGPVVGDLQWKNEPPSAAQIASLVEAGRKVPKAGSIILQLQSREKVDMAVADGRVFLAGHVPQVGRVFPHLRVVRCWNCFKYGHTRARCGVAARCGGCGKDAHGVICTEKPSCVNCGGTHRADNSACPTRKRIAEQLRQRAADLCQALDEQSSCKPSPGVTPSLSPLPLSLGLSGLPSSEPHPAPRLPERP
ncbi:hypothetical protein C8R47DRAFT_1222863 [Mycena vitilis]|nr:hypothetical protein C8R47DRAFT_1222863 [Mycena vitilis]